MISIQFSVRPLEFPHWFTRMFCPMHVQCFLSKLNLSKPSTPADESLSHVYQNELSSWHNSVHATHAGWRTHCHFASQICFPLGTSHVQCFHHIFPLPVPYSLWDCWKFSSGGHRHCSTSLWLAANREVWSLARLFSATTNHWFALCD